MPSLAQQQRRLVEQHRRAQVGIQAGFLAEFLAAWGLLRTEDLDHSTPQWLRIVIRLIRLFRQESADLSLNHYRDLRRIGAPDTEFSSPEVAFDLGKLVEPGQVRRRQTGPSVPARVERELSQVSRPARLTIHWDRADRAAVSSLQVAGPINIKERIKRGEKPEAAKRAALVDASGAGSRQVLNGGRATPLALVENDRAALGWVRVTDGDPCAFCAMLASRGVTWGPYAKSSFAKANEKFSGKAFEAEHDNDPRIIGRGEVKVHNHCVVPGTLVTGPSVEVAYRRPYEGELIIVGLADGGELSITPNHPVLTDRGWVEADLLREGDDVLGRAGADLASLDVPHENDVPTPIEDIWGSDRMDSLGAMPVTAEDFHGDGRGTQGYVNVVAPYSQFANELDFEGREHGAHQLVASADWTTAASALTAESDVLADLFSLGGVSQSGVSSSGIGGALLGPQLCLMHQTSLGHGSLFDSGVTEPSMYDVTRYSVAFAESLRRNAGAVLLDEKPVRRFDPASAGVGAAGWPGSDHASSQQAVTERGSVHADLGGALAERLAGGVQRRRVRELRRVHYSGHVLNLQTAEGWYDANGVIVSNCACAIALVFRRDDPLLDQGKEYRLLWDQYIKGRYSSEIAPGRQSDALKAWRRLHERPELFKKKLGETAEPEAA